MTWTDLQLTQALGRYLHLRAVRGIHLGLLAPFAIAVVYMTAQDQMSSTTGAGFLTVYAGMALLNNRLLRDAQRCCADLGVHDPGTYVRQLQSHDRTWVTTLAARCNFATSLTIAVAGLGVLAAFVGLLVPPWRTVTITVMTTLAVVAVLLAGLVVHLHIRLGRAGGWDVSQ